MGMLDTRPAPDPTPGDPSMTPFAPHHARRLARRLAIACNGLLDGLWLEGSVYPHGFREGELVECDGEVTRAGGSLIFLRGTLRSGERRLFTFSGTIKRVKWKRPPAA